MRLNLEVIHEDSKADCLICFAPFKSKILLQDVYIIHVAHYISVFEQLKKLLITNLLSSLGKLIDLHLQRTILKLELIEHGLRKLQQAHVDLFLFFLFFTERNVIVTYDLVHLLLSS